MLSVPPGDGDRSQEDRRLADQPAAPSAASGPQLMAQTCERLIRAACRSGASASSSVPCIPIFFGRNFV